MERRGLAFGRLAKWIVGGSALLLTGCASVAGAGIGAGLLALGFITHECYEHVDIKVIDGVTGNKICDAKVTAEQDGDVDTLGSCYYAPLTEGRWNLTATLPGRPPAKTSLLVAESEGCEPVVASVVLTIPPAPGAAPPAPPPFAPVPAAPPPAPAPPAAAPPPPSALPPAAAPSAAPAPSAPPAATSSSNPAQNTAPVEPAPSATPGTGVPTKSF
jgi:hypothetical protein